MFDLLVQHTSEDLLRVVRRFTAKPPTTKKGMAELLIAQTCVPALHQTLAMVGADGRRLLASAAHGNGLLRTARSTAPGYEMGSWERDWQSPRNQSTPSPVWVFFPDGRLMPAELRARLAKELPAPPAPPLIPLSGDPPGTVVPSDPLADIGVILHLAKEGELHAAWDGVSNDCLKRIVASATGVSGERRGDHLRMEALTAVLAQGGLLQLTAAGYRAKRSRIDQDGLRSLFAAYQRSGEDEIAGITAIRGRNDRYAAWSEPRERRAELLGVVRRCPPGAWIPIAEFLAHAGATAAIDPLLETTWAVSIGKNHVGDMDSLGSAGLDLLRDAWARFVIFTRLAPLGLVEIAVAAPAPLPRAIVKAMGRGRGCPDHLSPADTLTAFRITPLGAWMLGQGRKPDAVKEAPGGWRLQSDGTVVALGNRIGARERLLLDRIGEHLDERSWRISPPQLMAAMTDGGTADELRQQLMKLTGMALPEVVERSLEEARRRATAITVEGTVVLLRVSDSHAAGQLLHDRSTAQHCRDLGGGFIAVDPAAINGLRRAARKLGWHIPVHED